KSLLPKSLFLVPKVLIPCSQSPCSLNKRLGCFHSAVPVSDGRFGRIFLVRLKGPVDLPLVLYFIRVLPQADGQSGEVRRPDRRGFRQLWPYNLCLQDVRLELEQQVVCRCSAVDAELPDVGACI